MKLFQVDAFTDQPFRGNPAAVCWLDHVHDDAWLQAVAAEMNLSETAFVRRLDDGFELRWFTPRLEVDLCGHATLAAAHVLWEQGFVDTEREVTFQTKSGQLLAVQQPTGIQLDFPLMPPAASPAPDGLIESIGVQPRYVGKSRLDFLIEVDSANTVRKLRPDFARLAKINSFRGVIVTSTSDVPEFDFISRYFAPAAGIDEDPVTGSAHCSLAPYWRNKTGKNDFVAFQASARGGIVRVRVDGERAYLSGNAVTVFAGDLLT